MQQPSFQHSYGALPQRFFMPTQPAAVVDPRLVRLNAALAHHLGLDPQWLAGPEGVAMLSGTRLPESARPIALAYAGHQFGHFVPQLGDGRALLIGEVVDRDGVRRDVQLKGSGRTVFSRNGDGKAALGPVLREYLVCEAMAALAIPTTRALAAVTTGETLVREGRLLPGAVLTRVAASHIRVGTFQFFAARRDVEALKALAEYAIARHYPDAAPTRQPYAALLEAVIAAQAALMARWLLVGFVHGVMNTDNMAISGETIDYGPCAFMEAYDPATVFSSIDHGGRYAYANQPQIAQWNLTRLAEALLPLLAEDREDAAALARERLERFPALFEAAFRDGMRAKLGLAADMDGDIALAGELLEIMARGQADFTATFRALATEADGPGGTAAALFSGDEPRNAFAAWARRWRERLGREAVDPVARRTAMLAANPKYIARNHRVEAVIEAAVQRQDFAPFETLLSVLEKPFDEQPQREEYAAPAQAGERVTRTFCGT